MNYLKHILDHTTDIAAIAAICFIAFHGVATTEVIAAVSGIAVGKQYLRRKVTAE